MRDGAGSARSPLVAGSYVTHHDGRGDEYLVRLGGWEHQQQPVVEAAKQAGGMNAAIKALEKFVRGRLDAIGATGAKITFAPGPDTFDLDSETVPLTPAAERNAALDDFLKLGTITFHTGPKPETAGAVCACRLCKERKASDEKFGRILRGFAPPAASGPRLSDLGTPIFGSTRHATAQLAEINGTELDQSAINAIRESGFDRPLYKPLADAPKTEGQLLQWALDQLEKLCFDLETGRVITTDELMKRLQQTWIGVSE